MKIALVHDMLVQEGGQERVLRALQELFPEAPTFVLIYDRDKKEKFYHMNVRLGLMKERSSLSPFVVNRVEKIIYAMKRLP